MRRHVSHPRSDLFRQRCKQYLSAAVFLRRQGYISTGKWKRGLFPFAFEFAAGLIPLRDVGRLHLSEPLRLPWIESCGSGDRAEHDHSPVLILIAKSIRIRHKLSTMPPKAW